jgi:hypothetical protein
MTRLGVPEALIRRWVHLYTFALPRDVAEERWNEIWSDLWEQRSAASRNGAILRRAIAGAPADLGWRVTKGLLPPWLRVATRLSAAAAGCFILSNTQHQTEHHTLIGNATYGFYFVFAFGAFVAAVTGALQRSRG